MTTSKFPSPAEGARSSYQNPRISAIFPAPELPGAARFGPVSLGNFVVCGRWRVIGSLSQKR